MKQNSPLDPLFRFPSLLQRELLDLPIGGGALARESTIDYVHLAEYLANPVEETCTEGVMLTEGQSLTHVKVSVRCPLKR